jgi:hypothetical protein
MEGRIITKENAKKNAANLYDLDGMRIKDPTSGNVEVRDWKPKYPGSPSRL